MEFKITIPDYLSIGKYQEIQQYEHLSEVDGMIKILSIVSDKTENDIRELPPNVMVQIY